LNRARSPSQRYSNATADAAAEAEDANWWAQHARASGVVAQCWAVHDACLLDQSQDATTSPSCPDHTALNQPASASAAISSSSTTADNAAYAAATSATTIADTSGTATSNAPSSSQPSMAVVISALPPEWTKADRIHRKDTSPQQVPPHHPLQRSASLGAQEASGGAEESAAERRARKRARRQKRRRGEPVEPPRAASTSASVGSSSSHLDPSGSARKAGEAGNTDGSLFAFHGAMTLLPLSATVCEFEFGTP